MRWTPPAAAVRPTATAETATAADTAASTAAATVSETVHSITAKGHTEIL